MAATPCSRHQGNSACSIARSEVVKQLVAGDPTLAPGFPGGIKVGHVEVAYAQDRTCPAPKSLAGRDCPARGGIALQDLRTRKASSRRPAIASQNRFRRRRTSRLCRCGSCRDPGRGAGRRPQWADAPRQCTRSPGRSPRPRVGGGRMGTARWPPAPAKAAYLWRAGAVVTRLPCDERKKARSAAKRGRPAYTSSYPGYARQ